MTTQSFIRTLVAAVLVILATISLAADDQPIPAEAPQALQPVHTKAAIIRLTGTVDDIMKSSLVRRIDIARKAGATLIVVEIDSYGGQVTSALEISKLLKKLPDERIATVAWVHDKAYSAGAIIAVACQQIVTDPVSSIGDAAPIALAGDTLVPIPDAERAKIESPLLQELDDSAQRNGYPAALLRAMVVTGIQIDEVRNSVTGETRFVDAAVKTRLLDEELVAPDGKKVRPWRFERTVDSDKSLLTVSGKEAASMGLSRASVDNEEALRATLNIRGDLLVLDLNWVERAAMFFGQFWVRALLFVIMLVCFYLEFSHPGVSVPGILGVICLVLLVGAPYLAGLAQVWEIALIILGLLIIAIDVFAFGGIGLLAIPGFLLMAIGLVASFVPSEPGGGWLPTMSATWRALQNGLLVLIFGTLGAMAAFWALSRYLHLAPGFKRLQLAPETNAPTAETLVRDSLDRPAGDAVFIGAMGEATTDLRPSGKARFGDHVIDVISRGEFIKRSAEIRVVEITGGLVVVREAAEKGVAT